MPIEEIVKEIVRGEKVLVYPLKHVYGKIYDANSNMVLDIRGWGFLQYHAKGEDYAAKIQDGIGDWVAETLNKELKKLQ